VGSNRIYVGIPGGCELYGNLTAIQYNDYGHKRHSPEFNPTTMTIATGSDNRMSKRLYIVNQEYVDYNDRFQGDSVDRYRSYEGYVYFVWCCIYYIFHVAYDRFIHILRLITDQVTDKQRKMRMLFPPQSNGLDTEVRTAELIQDAVLSISDLMKEQ
jgi:hypothetical protein